MGWMSGDRDFLLRSNFEEGMALSDFTFSVEHWALSDGVKQ